MFCTCAYTPSKYTLYDSFFGLLAGAAWLEPPLSPPPLEAWSRHGPSPGERKPKKPFVRCAQVVQIATARAPSRKNIAALSRGPNNKKQETTNKETHTNETKQTTKNSAVPRTMPRMVPVPVQTVPGQATGSCRVARPVFLDGTKGKVVSESHRISFDLRS